MMETFEAWKNFLIVRTISRAKHTCALDFCECFPPIDARCRILTINRTMKIVMMINDIHDIFLCAVVI